jgi:hypothetical protein
MSWTTPAQRDGLDSHRRGDNLMTTWFHAMRQAIRRLGREPLFALVALSTLALGIGANVAVFSFVNAYLVTPLPVPASQELVRVYGHSNESSYDTLSYPTYRDIRDGTPGLDLAAHGFARVLVGAGDAIEARPMELVTGNYFRILRLTPLAGRLIEAHDDVAEGSGPVVVLSEPLWRSGYASDRGIIGRTVQLNGAPFEVIGVAPAGFRGTWISGRRSRCSRRCGREGCRRCGRRGCRLPRAAGAGSAPSAVCRHPRRRPSSTARSPRSRPI